MLIKNPAYGKLKISNLGHLFHSLIATSMKIVNILIFTLVVAPAISFSQVPAGLQSSLKTVNIGSKKIETIVSLNQHFEAPNWSNDGKFFIINSNGKLYKVLKNKPDLQLIPTGSADQVNNDHGISPNGKLLAISHNKPVNGGRSSSIYVLPIGGGAPVEVTTKSPSYWHGWSADGKTLAYCAERNGNYDVYSIPVGGGEENRLTSTEGLDDGPDYSPDGKYIYYNSFQSGKMHIWRMNTDGSEPKQLTNDAYSNWFAHPSPDGKWLAYISYVEDQGQAHPFGKDVKLRLMSLETSEITDLTDVFYGGQGTFNVPSWSPDSRQVAFVSYEVPKD